MVKRYVLMSLGIMAMMVAFIVLPITIDFFLRDDNGEVMLVSSFLSPVETPSDVLASGGEASVYIPVAQAVASADFDFMDRFLEIVTTIFDNPQVKFIIAHIILNFVVAVAVSLYLETFSISKIWEVFGKKLLPLIGTYFTFDLIGALLGGDLIPMAVFAAIEAALLADLLHNLDKVPALKPILAYVPGFMKKFVKLPIEVVENEEGTYVNL